MQGRAVPNKSKEQADTIRRGIESNRLFRHLDEEQKNNLVKVRPGVARGALWARAARLSSACPLTPHPLPALLRLRLRGLRAVRCQHCVLLEFAPNEAVVEQGEYGDNFYILDSGTVELERSDSGVPVKVGRRGRAESFGEGAMIYDARRSCTVRAKSAVRARGVAPLRRLRVRPASSWRRWRRSFPLPGGGEGGSPPVAPSFPGRGRPNAH